MTDKQKYMLDQVTATMRIEDMPLTPQAYKNLRLIAQNKKSSDVIITEIKKRYTHG